MPKRRNRKAAIISPTGLDRKRVESKTAGIAAMPKPVFPMIPLSELSLHGLEYRNGKMVVKAEPSATIDKFMQDERMHSAFALERLSLVRDLRREGFTVWVPEAKNGNEPVTNQRQSFIELARKAGARTFRVARGGSYDSTYSRDTYSVAKGIRFVSPSAVSEKKNKGEALCGRFRQ
ncbi:MAG: hypothetical protein V1493_05805 [Candidatus Diapherotrites archaeon]